MIKINLLPYRELFLKRKAIRQLIGAAIILVILLVVIVIIDNSLTGQITALKNQISMTQNTVANLNKLTAEIYQFEKSQNEFQQKLDKIKALNRGRKLPVHILEEISKATPEKLWLNQFSREQSAIVLTGIALDQETIVSFLNNLEDSEYLSDIRLIQTQQFSHQNLKLQRFHIVGRIQSPQPAEKSPASAGGQKLG